MARIIEGPAGAGNSFGIYREDLVPAGRFAIVENGEYANGGYGPSSVDGKSYPTREAALEALAMYVLAADELPGSAWLG